VNQDSSHITSIEVRKKTVKVKTNDGSASEPEVEAVLGSKKSDGDFSEQVSHPLSTPVTRKSTFDLDEFLFNLILLAIFIGAGVIWPLWWLAKYDFSEPPRGAWVEEGMMITSQGMFEYNPEPGDSSKEPFPYSGKRHPTAVALHSLFGKEGLMHCWVFLGILSSSCTLLKLVILSIVRQ